MRLVQMIEIGAPVWAVCATKAGKPEFVPVHCFGSVDIDGTPNTRRVVGIVVDGDIRYGHQFPGFLGYARKQCAANWEERAASHARRLKREAADIVNQHTRG